MESFLRSRVDLQNIYNSSSAMSLGGGGDAHYFEDLITPEKVRQYLNSTNESDKLKGMKVLLAMLSKGKDIPEYFPDVVKNVVVKSVEVKKMVYMYMVRYADFDQTCREIALLSINTFQKDMNEANPFIRGIALRVMTSIRVDDVIQIQLHAIRSCAIDGSPYVRKCAANAIPKIYYLDPSKLDHLKGLLETLLKDNSTMVLGSALAAFNEVCPAAYELLHPNFRKICYLLADMDEWTQVPILEVLARYVRHHFTDPSPATIRPQRTAAVDATLSLPSSQNHVKPKRRVVKNAFYSDDEDQSEEEQEEERVSRPQSRPCDEVDPEEVHLDPDHRLVLKSSLPLLKSRNAGVVISVAALHYYCGPRGAQVQLHQVAKAMVRILRTRREVQFVVLHSVRAMARERPAIFRPFLSDFVVKSTDPLFNKLLKVDILTALACADNANRLLKEYQLYAADRSDCLVVHAVTAVGLVAEADPSVAGPCMEGIMQLLMRSTSGSVVSACVASLCQLLKQNTHLKICVGIVKQLMKRLLTEHGVDEPKARSYIVWLAGEFHALLADASPDILRVLSMGYSEESVDTRLQILNLAIKLSLRMPENDKVQLLATYVLEMARYDPDTDLRDRSRLMTALMGLSPSTADDGEEHDDDYAVDEDSLAALSEHAAKVMLAVKLPPVTTVSDVHEGYYVGSLSSIVSHNAIGYIPIADWAKEPVPSVRENSDGAGTDLFSGDRKTSADNYDIRAFYDGEESSSDSSSDDDSSNDDESDGSSTDSSEESANSDDDSSSRSSDDSATSSTSTDEDGSVESRSDKSRTSHGVRRNTSGPVTIQSNSASINSGTPASTASNSVIIQHRSRSIMSNAGMKKVASLKTGNSFDKRVAAAGSVDLLGTADPDSTSQSSASPHRVPLFSNVPHVPISGAAALIGSMDGPDLLSGWTTNNSNPIVFSSNITDSGFSNTNPSQGINTTTTPGINSMHSMAFNTMTSHQGIIPMNPSILYPTSQGMVPGTSIVSQPSMDSSHRQQMALHPPHSTALSIIGDSFPIGESSLSAPKLVLRPEMGGGLKLFVSFRRSAMHYTATSTVDSDVFQAVLSVTNCRDHPIRRVRITVQSMDPNRSSTTLPEIAVIPPASQLIRSSYPAAPNPHEVAFPVDLVLLNSNVKQLKVDVRSEFGVFTGSLSVEEWDLVRPLSINVFDFESCRSRLGGFCENSRSYPLSTITADAKEEGGTGDVERQIQQRVQRALFVSAVQGLNKRELMFAGCIRKGSETQRLLITVSLNSDHVKVRINCEDPVFCSRLSDVFVKLLP